MSFEISIAFGSGSDRGLSKISRMTKNGIFDKINLIVKNKTNIILLYKMMSNMSNYTKCTVTN